jgi:hypothetical protein
MATILQRIAEKLLIHKKDVELVKLDNQIEMIDSLKAIEKNTAEKPEKPEKIDFTEVIAKLDTLTEEVKKKEQSEYDLQIDPETREKLRGEKGEKGEAGKSIKPTKAELEAIIRSVVPDYVPTQEDLELLLEGIDKGDDLSQVKEEIAKLSDDIAELKTFDPEEFSKETIKKALGFMPSRSGGGVQSVISSDGSVQVTSSMAKGKGVVDLRVTGGGGSGDVVGPASSVDNEIVLFSGITGKLIKSAGKTLASFFDKTTDDTDDITEGATNKFNQTHTGEVTGATTLTIDKTAITNKTGTLPVGADYILFSDTSDSGNLKKALISDLPSGGGGGSVNSVVAGDNVTVDNTDPANPIVSAYFGSVEGGSASSIYLASQVISGGNA